MARNNAAQERIHALCDELRQVHAEAHATARALRDEIDWLWREWFIAIQVFSDCDKCRKEGEICTQLVDECECNALLEDRARRRFKA